MSQCSDPPAAPGPFAKATVSETPGLLHPGVYRIINNVEPNQAFDLSGYDMKAYPAHEGANQKWDIERLGPGYTIRSIYNGSYVTLDSGIASGATLIGTPYPVSWAVEPDDWEAGIYRIRWPMSSYIVDMPAIGTHGVQLSHRYPFKDRALWRLDPVDHPKQINDHQEERPSQLNDADQFELITHSPRTAAPATPGLATNSDTIIDVEGLKLGGNGEMSITTTTTTVTTSVTTVKRLGVRS
ncbi:hypothetical protein D9619_008362 [Psilocybe cf. subviscida]|uniref:Ricin B lectin domain-containing protein n=1 Tax=Psilocybe cf. subviscida TaxID=2480587 RepID=A0A8H5BBB5_9AGAR|nr:hypothetical protein D9619_008362 [Psilocybe cf. subviscida]